MDDATPRPCGDDLRTLLSRHVDGELTAEEHAKVEEHLADCAGCRELLGLFRKNEDLLANALSTESFGNEVIESVMGEIRREEPPPVARPVEEGAWDWLRSRPLIPLAASALLVVGVLLVLNGSHSRQMSLLKDQVAAQQAAFESARKAYEALQADSRRESRQALAMFETYEREILDRTMRQAVAGAGQHWALTYQDPDRRLVIKMAPDPAPNTLYELHRRHEKEERFEKISGAAELQSPEFTDSKVKPGETYVYKFRVFRPGGEPFDSPHYRYRLPFAGDLSPEKSVRVLCREAGAQRDTGVFVLERTVNGKTVSENFYPSLGDRLGGVRDVPGAGPVDFTTDLVLHSFKEGEQALTVQSTAPVYDPDGRLVMREVQKGVLVPQTREAPLTLSIRHNVRAVLKPVGAPNQPEESLWKGSWLRVRARD